MQVVWLSQSFNSVLILYIMWGLETKLSFFSKGYLINSTLFIKPFGHWFISWYASFMMNKTFIFACFVLGPLLHSTDLIYLYLWAKTRKVLLPLKCVWAPPETNYPSLLFFFHLQGKVYAVIRGLTTWISCLLLCDKSPHTEQM